MNKERYILVGQTAIIAIINSLRQIDEVKGYENMDTLVGCVCALQKIVQDSPQVDIEDKEPEHIASDIESEIAEAAKAAKAEEEARR